MISNWRSIKVEGTKELLSSLHLTGGTELLHIDTDQVRRCAAVVFP